MPDLLSLIKDRVTLAQRGGTIVFHCESPEHATEIVNALSADYKICANCRFGWNICNCSHGTPDWQPYNFPLRQLDGTTKCESNLHRRLGFLEGLLGMLETLRDDELRPAIERGIRRYHEI